MIKKTATFSPDRVYRYVLERVLNENEKTCMFIGLNPSTADETNDDPTVRRCINFVRAWGYGTLLMTNIFAYRSTDPKKLYEVEDPVGNENDWWLVECRTRSSLVVGAWGNIGTYHDRGKQVITLISAHQLRCLGVTKTLQPRHPLYLRGDLFSMLYEDAIKNPDFIPIRKPPKTLLDFK